VVGSSSHVKPLAGLIADEQKSTVTAIPQPVAVSTAAPAVDVLAPLAVFNASEDTGWCKLVWVFNDEMGLRQQLFQGLGMQTQQYDHKLHSKGHLNLMLQRQQTSKPDLLWIKLAGPCIGSNNKRDRQRANNLQRLVMQQISLGNHVVLEANAKNPCWQIDSISELTHAAVDGKPVLTLSQHRWCNYDVCNQAGLAVTTTSQFASTLSFSSCAECNCGRSQDQHQRSDPGNAAATSQTQCDFLDRIADKVAQALGHKQPKSSFTPQAPARTRIIPLMTRAVISNATSQQRNNTWHQASETDKSCTSPRSPQTLPGDPMPVPPRGVHFNVEQQAFPTEESIRQREQQKRNKLAGNAIVKRKPTSRTTS
jgi:hypothetical protein